MEIIGIWKNNTDRSIAITINGMRYTGIIDSQGQSDVMNMNLDGLQMLKLQILDDKAMSQPILQWIDASAQLPTIMQQAVRFSDWEYVPVEPRDLFNHYVFHVEASDGDGGLLIVGTVELVEPSMVLAAN